MNRLTVILFLLIGFSSFAHEYHFAFAEVEYNTQDSVFQTSISITTNDFEHELQSAKVINTHLDKALSNDSLKEIIVNYIQVHFEIYQFTGKIPLNCDGFEITNNGMTHFYFSSSKVKMEEEITVLFDVLMDHSIDQQNKMTFIYEDKKLTETFLFNYRTKTIKPRNI